MHSVEQLAKLTLAAGTGHGVSIRGLDLALELSRLVRNFEERPIPSEGRYVQEPAINDEEGIVWMPEPTSYNVARAIGIGVLVGVRLYFLLRKRE